MKDIDKKLSGREQQIWHTAYDQLFNKYMPVILLKNDGTNLLFCDDEFAEKNEIEDWYYVNSIYRFFENIDGIKICDNDKNEFVELVID